MMDADDGYILWTGIWKGRSLYLSLLLAMCLKMLPFSSWERQRYFVFHGVRPALDSS